MNGHLPFDPNVAMAAQQRDTLFVELARTKVRLEELERDHTLLATREKNAMKRVALLDKLADPVKTIAAWRDPAGEGWDCPHVPLGLAGALDELVQVVELLAKEGVL